MSKVGRPKGPEKYPISIRLPLNYLSQIDRMAENEGVSRHQVSYELLVSALASSLDSNAIAINNRSRELKIPA